MSLQQQREEIRCLLLKRGNGSFLRGWRCELDPYGLLEAPYGLLRALLERHAVKVDLKLLFGHDERSIRLEEVCPSSLELVKSIQSFVKQQFGGPEAMVPAGEHQTPEGLARLWRLRGFKASEEEVRELLSFADCGPQGVAGEDLAFLEADGLQRKQLAARLRQKRQLKQQEVLQEAFSQETYELPKSHRLAVRPWQASSFERLPNVQQRRQQQWQRTQRKRHRKAKELFLAHLKDLSGTVVRAWRTKLDPENRSAVDFVALRRYCARANVALDAPLLWQAFGGPLRLEVLSPAAAEALAAFRAWATAQFGGCVAFWEDDEVAEARRRPVGRWRSEKKMLLGHLASLLKEHFSRPAPPLLLNSLDEYGCGFVSRSDFAWLDQWTPLPWIATAADAEEWAILKKMLIRLEGHPLTAWRRRLDKEDCNQVVWADFERCFGELQSRRNVAGAWRHVDAEARGFISFKAYDPAAFELLRSFKTWAEQHFGSLQRALQVLDQDRSGSISLPELKRACEKRSWTGDVDMLARCLALPEEDPTISLAEIGFLDHWEVSSSEEDAASAPPRLPKLRAKSQPAPRAEAAASAPSLRISPVEAENGVPLKAKKVKDGRKEHEQWVQQREQEVKSVYRVASEKLVSSSEVTNRLYHPQLKDPETGVPSWLHSLRARSEVGQVPRRPRASIEKPPLPRPEVPLPDVPLEPIYRYGSHGAVVAPFHLHESPLQQRDFER